MGCAWAAVPGDGGPEWPEWARGDQQHKDRIGDLLGRWTAGTFEKRELARCGGSIYDLEGRPRRQRRRPRDGRNDDLQV